jgi:hypothetical protein
MYIFTAVRLKSHITLTSVIHVAKHLVISFQTEHPLIEMPELDIKTLIIFILVYLLGSWNRQTKLDAWVCEQLRP